MSGMVRLSRRVVLALAPLAPLMVRTLLSQKTSRRPLLYAGTYTHDTGPGGESDGIHVAEWHESTGTLAPWHRAVATVDPSFLAVPPTGEALFCVNEAETMPEPDGSKGGSVSAFRRDPNSGSLTLVNHVPSFGSDPCHLTTDRAGRVVYVANYTSGSLASYRVEAGRLVGPVSHIAFPGHGPDKERQDHAHTHCVTLSPDERYLLVNDLGIDSILVFRTDLATAKLDEPIFRWHAKPGSGPRHTHFHPNGRWVYSVNELSATVDALAWDASTGHLSLLSEVSIRPSGASGHSKAAELAIDRSGHFLYASDRAINDPADDAMVVFAIDPGSGGLHFVQRLASGGRNPRSFTLDPSERWVLVANQDSQSVVVFARHPQNGRLTPTGRSYKLGAPVCLLFV